MADMILGKETERLIGDLIEIEDREKQRLKELDKEKPEWENMNY